MRSEVVLGGDQVRLPSADKELFPKYSKYWMLMGRLSGEFSLAQVIEGDVENFAIFMIVTMADRRLT